MKTWTAWVTKTERYPVTVHAETYLDAREAAQGIVPGDGDGAAEVTFRADNFVQTSEPWAYSNGWYDLHGPGNVIVVERAPGNLFTADDIHLLGLRIKAMDLVVVGCWNG